MPIIGPSDGFGWKCRDLKRSAQLALDGWARAKAAIRSGEHFLVAVDEVMYPLHYGWVPVPVPVPVPVAVALTPVLACLRERPSNVSVVLTGRSAPLELIDVADTVTDMTLVKHHFEAGVPAQRGIEDSARRLPQRRSAPRSAGAPAKTAASPGCAPANGASPSAPS